MRSVGYQSINIATQLDHLRSAMLRLTMKSSLLRQIYRSRTSRLTINYLLLSTVYLMLSLKWSLVMLVLGPLLLGYPHLVASYRFVQNPAVGFTFRWASQIVFRFFIFLTMGSLLIRFVLPQIFTLPLMPYGGWEILLSISALAMVRLKLNSVTNILVLLLTILISVSVLALAWQDPLAFVGIALIFHNWVAFGHWFLAARDLKNKVVAVAATAVFALVHWFVFTGHFDAWITFSELSFLSTRSFEVKGWVLAPWTDDPLVWSRMIVLYAFGLSVHYFIWLQAIPQCLDEKSVPNSFRASLRALRKDCGPQTAMVLVGLGLIVAVAMWFHTAYAGRIYFGIAMLHGWLEFVFLALALSGYLLRRRT